MASWNHRVVRRYSEDGKSTWLEITEVHYRHGKAYAFAIQMGAPSATMTSPWDMVTEPTALANLRWTLNAMQTALAQPILDEKTDF